jgi:hypothetical protein
MIFWTKNLINSPQIVKRKSYSGDSWKIYLDELDYYSTGRNHVKIRPTYVASIGVFDAI